MKDANPAIACGLLITVSLLGGSMAFADPAPDQADVAAGSENNLTEIVVTARRRAENLQTVPDSVQAFSSQELTEKNILSTQDLQRLTPGVVFNGAGSPENTTYSIRGQGKDVIGPGLPSVISYINEVPMPSWGSVLPTYDISNVQILKGPQGTLFGRNTTGGAVLVYTQKPTNDLEGYAQLTYGNYDWKGFQGAINVPIISDVVALRVATDIERREGYTRVNGPGGSENDMNSNSFRVSLLVTPTENFTNLTVVDYWESNTNNAAQIPIGAIANPLYDQGAAAFGPAFGAYINSLYNCKTSINCSVDLQLQRQLAAGPWTTWTNSPTKDDTSIYGVSNTSTLNLGPVTLTNIGGFRRDEIYQFDDTGGIALPLIYTTSQRHDMQLSDEFHVSGDAFNKKLNYIGGVFYLDSQPIGGATGLANNFLVTPAAGSLAGLSNDTYSDRSKAAFGNLSYEIIDGLKVDAGVRHTWDTEAVCAVTFTAESPGGSRFIDDQECRALESSATTPSFADQKDFQANTWSIGLDYQVTHDLFTYVIARKGYRSGGINTPLLVGALAQYQFYGPQYINDVEVGEKYEWSLGGWQGRFNTSFFRGNFSKLQNQITGIPPGFAGDTPASAPSNTALIVNEGKSRVQGIELDSEVSPFKGLSFEFAGSYLNAKYTEFATPELFADIAGGAPIYQNSPKWSYTATGSYEAPWQVDDTSFALHADFYHVDDYIVGAVTVPGYSLVNASLDANHVAGTKLTVSLFGNNLANRAYINGSDLTGTSPGLFVMDFGPPRMYGVRIRYDFK